MTLAAICPSDLALERFLLGEVPEGSPDLTEHVATCPMCRDALAAKRKDNLEFRASPGAARIARALAAGDRAPSDRASSDRSGDAPRDGAKRDHRGYGPGDSAKWLTRFAFDRRVFASFAVAAAIALAFAIARRHSPVAPSADAREERVVLQVQREWMEAIRDKDAATLDRILADDYIYTDSRGGVTNKADSLRKTNNHNDRMKAFHTSEETARVYGDMAIVTGRLRVEGIAGGQAYDAEVRFTDILARIDGRWRAVAAHASRSGERRAP
jgi:ketosteroid isomerase-like protein